MVKWLIGLVVGVILFGSVISILWGSVHDTRDPITTYSATAVAHATATPVRITVTKVPIFANSQSVTVAGTPYATSTYDVNNATGLITFHQANRPATGTDISVTYHWAGGGGTTGTLFFVLFLSVILIVIIWAFRSADIEF